MTMEMIGFFLYVVGLPLVALVAMILMGEW